MEKSLCYQRNSRKTFHLKFQIEFIYIYIYIMHHNLCFNLFILHNSFDNQGSKIIKKNTLLRFHILSFMKTFFLCIYTYIHIHSYKHVCICIYIIYTVYNRENTSKNNIIIPNQFRPWLFSRGIILNVIYNKILCYLTSVGLCTSDFSSICRKKKVKLTLRVLHSMVLIQFLV